ncbi:AAA family ATPase [Acidaminococcus timonensis]|uniref:AAA family ATPase n=1 Tax=Acidaminococcus timonensis TaxID=1871002 RepID=UPI00266506C4|nr:AAA family ATPase [uncultured Acidaminococcus sp.]
MSNRQEAKQLLRRYLIARIPFIVLQTIEVPRALALLKEIAEELDQEQWLGRDTFYAHTLSKGVYALCTGQTVDEGAKSTLGAGDFFITKLQKEDRRDQTLILTEIPDISDDNSEAQRMLDLVSLATEKYSTLVVFCHRPVWNNLQRHGLIVTLDMPDEEEMYQVIHDQLEGNRDAVDIQWDEGDMREAAATLAGVTKIEAENVLSALLAKGSVTKADMAEVRNAKNRLFSNISGLEKIAVDPTMKKVGGLKGLQAWLDEKKALLKPEKKELMRKLHLQPPRGILLVGVPGCGKSLSAKAIAANWELPLYRLDFATVQGSYVGQSERQLRDALTTAENVSPCILWIDEIEKGLSGASSNNDGGVSTRMVGQFLFWLQECRKAVFVVATANDVSMLPSELLRRGRFDELFFVDLPTEEEREDILHLYFQRYLQVDIHSNEDFAGQLVALTDGFTGADLESAVRELAYRKVAEPEHELTRGEILSSFQNVVPLSQTSPEKINSIRNWGKERAVPASGRPIGEEKLPTHTGNLVRRVLVRKKEE